jgi:RNA polymerase sigma-70 factor (ECF subfamily)
MQPENDELLVEKLRAGNEQAFTLIYDRYYTRLHLEANYRLRNSEEAADVVHDVFANIWKKKTELPDALSLKAYLSNSVRNKCIDKIRKHAQFQHYAGQQKDVEEAVTPTDPAATREIATKIHNAIGELPPAQRNVFELAYSGLSHKEIKGQTGKSIQTIKNLLGTAKKTLRDKLLIIHHT